MRHCKGATVPQCQKPSACPDELVPCHWQNFPISTLKSHGRKPLSHRKAFQHTGAQPGCVCIPTPARCLSPGTTPDKNNSSRWVHRYLVSTAQPPAPAPSPPMSSMSLDPVCAARSQHGVMIILNQSLFRNLFMYFKTVHLSTMFKFDFFLNNF